MLVLPSFLTETMNIGTVLLPFSLLDIVLKLIVPVLLGFILLGVIKHIIIRRAIYKMQVRDAVQKNFLRTANVIVYIVRILLLAVCIFWLLGGKIGVVSLWFWQIFSTPLLSLGDTSISILSILLIIPVFYLASWVSKLSKRAIEQSITSGLGLPSDKYAGVLSSFRFIIRIVVLMLGLSIIGIDFSSLTVLLGLLGVGIGFGLQNVIANIFAGLTIVFTSPIKEGDRILVGSIEGTIIQIKLLHTIVNTLSQETIIIPNADFTSKVVHNYSYNDARVIITNVIEVSYDSDIEFVRRILIETVKKNPYAIPDKEPVCLINSFNESGIEMKIRTWIHTANERFESMGWNNMEIWRMFREHNISIPFPQRDLHIKSAHSAEAASQSFEKRAENDNTPNPI